MSLPRDYIIPQPRVGLHAGSVIEDGENVTVVAGEAPTRQIGSVEEPLGIAEDDSVVDEGRRLLTRSQPNLRRLERVGCSWQFHDASPLSNPHRSSFSAQSQWGGVQVGQSLR